MIQSFLNSLDQFDRSIFEWILLNLNPKWVVLFCNFIVKDSHLGIAGLIIFVYYFRQNKKRSLILLFISLAAIGLSDGSSSMLKKLFERPRPAEALNIFYAFNAFSFPSAHASNSMTLGIILGKYFPGKKYLYFCLSLFIGICRMLAGFHFPGDILGGWTLGLILGVILFFILDKFVIPRERLLSI